MTSSQTPTSGVVATEAHTEDPTLSVVVPVYNEAEHIGDCLESILHACRGDLRAEIVVVDSNSEDETVNIASDYPATVVRIPDDDLTTPGAGRYVGTQLTTGEELLFIDGDITIEANWLSEAREALSAEGIVGVDGQLNDSADTDTPEFVDSISAVALYDREALSSTGGFNPFMYSLEDIHLGFQLTAAGYRLISLPTVAGHHHNSAGISEVRRRWENGYFFGPGQALRRSVDTPGILIKHLLRMKFNFIVILWVGFGAVSLLSLPVASCWLALSLYVFVTVAQRDGLDQAIQRAIGYLVVSLGLIRGVMMDVPSPSSFPMDRVEIVSIGPVIQP